MIEWEEGPFVSVPLCNTYSLHGIVERDPIDKDDVVVAVITLTGKALLINSDGNVQVEVNLKDLLNENLDQGHDLELVASDSANRSSSNNLMLIATCWIVQDALYKLVRYIAATFRISNDFKATLGCRFDLEKPPTYCRLALAGPSTTFVGHHHVWLIFSAMNDVQCYSVTTETGECELLSSVGDVYPELDLGSLPGSAIRSTCHHSAKTRWSAIGTDTGHVIASVSQADSNYIQDRKTLKFNGVISVLCFMANEMNDDQMMVLISSTMGPAAIWTLTFKVQGRRIVLAKGIDVGKLGDT